jgi:hypothetical protein
LSSGIGPSPNWPGTNLYGGNKLQTIAPDGANHVLSVAIVADCPSDGVDGEAERLLVHAHASPHNSKELIAGDHPIPVFDQVEQEIKRSGL